MLPLDVDALKAAIHRGESFDYLFFWGHTPREDGAISDACFSQWWAAPFAIEGQRYPTAEHWMMAQKARLFGDQAMLAEILAADTPAHAKKLGRQVKGFDEATWKAQRFDLVTRGNVAKFESAPELRSYLLGTGLTLLVEASPMDRVWGIGLGAKAPAARSPLSWRGLNLLGFALVRTRAILRGELPRPPSAAAQIR